MKMIHLRIQEWLILMLILMSGCVGDYWERYANPDYGNERAERICHPYADCSQGVWVATARAEVDSTRAYRMCQEQSQEHHTGWSESTVSMGLEVGRCMRSKGYELKRQ